MTDEKKRDFRSSLAEKWHDRAVRSGAETRRLLLSFASGGVGIFFFALTGKIDPALTFTQQCAVAASTILFGISALAAMAAWRAEAKASYAWALTIQARERSVRAKNHRTSRGWFRWRGVAIGVQFWTFIAGLAAAILYTIARIWHSDPDK